MAKNRYARNGTTKFVQGRMKVLEAINKKLYRVELWLLNDEVNRNGWKYINLDRHLEEFRNIPILVAYLPGGIIGDGHNYDIRRDPKTGQEYASFMAADAERIVGWIPESASVRVEKRDGIDWVVATGFLWTWYARELVEKIAQQGGGLDISIETLVTKEKKDGAVDIEEEYIVLGITVLGNGVAPAVAGATIKSLAALRESMKNEILKASSFIQEMPQKTNEKGVNAMPISKRRLNNLGNGFDGYTCVGASADAKNIALISDSAWAPYGYTFADTDNGTIIKERIREASAEVHFSFNDTSVVTSLEAVMEKPNAMLAQLAAERDTYKEQAEKLAAEITNMKARENSRRLQAAKDTISDELRIRNQNRQENERFSEEICKDLMQRVENNEFTAMEDADGNWTGENAVRTAVKSLCMDEQTKMDAEARKKDKQYFTWGLHENRAQSTDLTYGEKMAAGIHE